MAITDFAQGYHEKMFPGYRSDFLRTDPEFIERFDNFAFDEVLHMPLQEGWQPIGDAAFGGGDASAGAFPARMSAFLNTRPPKSAILSA